MLSSIMLMGGSIDSYFTGKCEIVNVDMHFNDLNNIIPPIPKNLLTHNVTITKRTEIDPETGKKINSFLGDFQCRIEVYNKSNDAIDGDTRKFKWVLYIPYNQHRIHHFKLHLI